MSKLSYLSIFVILTSFSNLLLAQDYNDCNSSLQICELTTHKIKSFNGSGLHEEDIKASCAESIQETNSKWLRWSIAEPGNLTFIITPENSNDDIDFVLYKTSGDCNNLIELRCMASGKTFGLESNLNSKCLGTTGLSLTSEDYSEASGCDKEDDNFLKHINVKKGEEYILFLNNFDSSRGFSITFEGTCNFTPCHVEPINNSPIEVSIYPIPTKDFINILLSTRNPKEIQINLYDIKGEVLLRKIIHPHKGEVSHKLNLKNLAPGNYLVEIIQDDTSRIKKITKN